MFLTNVKKFIIKETFIRVYTLLSITVKDSLRQYRLIIVSYFRYLYYE
nr:MAG TPA: hypothetical protein [Caudoviricetes sp.]DAP51415.1 MAG TPA: hypothetical protein [Caudoviricetes sp.]